MMFAGFLFTAANHAGITWDQRSHFEHSPRLGGHLTAEFLSISRRGKRFTPREREQALIALNISPADYAAVWECLEMVLPKDPSGPTRAELSAIFPVVLLRALDRTR